MIILFIQGLGAVGAEGAPLSSRKTWMPKGPRAWRYGGFSRAGWTPRFPDGSGGSPPGWKRARTPTLLSPEPRGLSVKIRGGRALEAKAYRGSPGSLDVAGRARGRMESWRKWTTALDPSSREGRDPSCWRPVGKTRRVAQFSLAGGRSYRVRRRGATSRGAIWNSPKSACRTRTGRPWDSRPRVQTRTP